MVLFATNMPVLLVTVCGTLPVRPMLLLAVLACSVLGASASSNRLTFKDITLSATQPDGLRDTPVVDPPRRIAGYFKLNRTHDAHMFFFFFESRSKPQADPVVLWMTGEPRIS